MPKAAAIAARTDAGVALTVYVAEGPIRLELRPRQALRLGLDLINLAAAKWFMLGGGPEEDPAGDEPRPVNPPAVGRRLKMRNQP